MGLAGAEPNANLMRSQCIATPELGRWELFDTDMTHVYLWVEACNQSLYKLVHPKLEAYVLGGRVGVSGTQCCAR